MERARLCPLVLAGAGRVAERLGQIAAAFIKLVFVRGVWPRDLVAARSS